MSAATNKLRAAVGCLALEVDSIIQMGIAKEVRAVVEESYKLRSALIDALDIIEFMSGSEDFSPGGQAHEGWVRAQETLRMCREVKDETA